MPLRRKWTYLRVDTATHDRVAVFAERLDRPMVQVVADAMELFGRLHRKGLRMQQDALIFFIVYVDDKPLYAVAAKDAEQAVRGFRENMLGRVTWKTLKAVEAMDAPFEDATRVLMLSLLTQLAQFTQTLALLGQQQGARKSSRLVS